MTYWNRAVEEDEVICDPCGDARWPVHPKYGTNTDARLRERSETGADWCWDRLYSDKAEFECLVCGELTR
jgi:hypothetical protein